MTHFFIIIFKPKYIKFFMNYFMKFMNDQSNTFALQVYFILRLRY